MRARMELGTDLSAGVPCARQRSEPCQLGAGRCDAELARSEIDEHGDPGLDTDDRAEAVLVVGDLVIHRVALGRLRDRFWNVEGTTWQLAPGRGAERSHLLQYAPYRCEARDISAVGPRCLSRSRWHDLIA